MTLRRVFSRIACPDCGSSRLVPLTVSHNALPDEQVVIGPEGVGDALLFKCVACGLPFKWLEQIVT